MKKTKKIISLALALAMALPFLAGCHTSKPLPEFVMPDSFDSDREYEVVFWAKNDTNSSQVAVYDKAAADFNALYPNIKVKIVYYTDYNQIYQDVITNIQTRTTPNVCISYPDHIATYLTGAGTMVSLDELIADEKYGLGGSELKFDGVKKDEIVPEYFAEGFIDGKCYQLPFMRSTEALYINKTYVEALGYTVPDVLTWDFVWEVSEKALEKDADGNFKINGQNILIPFMYKSTDNMLIQMLRQKNADYSDADGNIKVFNDTTRSLLTTVAEHTASGAFSTFKFSSYPANFLVKGQCIFAVDSTAGSTWMGCDPPLCDVDASNPLDFETVVRPIPQFDTSSPKMISQGPSVCVFNKADPQEVVASWLFTQFLLTNSVQIAYSQTEGYVPVTKKAQEDPSYKEYLSLGGTDNELHYKVKLDAVTLLLENQANTFVAPVFNGSASLRSACTDMVERVVKSVRRKETVDDAYLTALFEDIPVKFHF